MRLFEFLLILVLAVACIGLGRWGFGEHDGRLAAESGLRAALISRNSDTTARSRADAACLQGSAGGFRAGQLAARLTAPTPRPASGPRPMISADELAQEVQP